MILSTIDFMIVRVQIQFRWFSAHAHNLWLYLDAVQDVYGEGVLSVISVIPNEVSSRSHPCIWFEVMMGIFSPNWNPVGDSNTFLPTERQAAKALSSGVGLCSSPWLSQSGDSIPVIILSVNLETKIVIYLLFFLCFCVCVLLCPMGPAIINLEPWTLTDVNNDITS